MKLLLTGASGQLGREWQAWLTSIGHDDFYFVPYTSSQLDITRTKELYHEVDQQQPDVIVNCAAYTRVDDAEDHPEKARAVNTDAVRQLAELCAEENILLVHFSTDYIFPGKRSDQEQCPDGYPENHPAAPINVYGETKWEGEEAIRASGCRHIIMRISWLCGAFGGNFVKTMLRLSQDRDELDVVDDQLASPTFTYSLVRNTLKLIEQECSGTYHYCSNGVITWADFAETIFELANRETLVNRVSSDAFPTKAKRPHFSKLCTDKIAQVGGIHLENWKVELSHLLKQLKKNQKH